MYNSFDNFFKVVNIQVIAKKFVFAIKYSKTLKKKILYKVWLEYNKNRFYKAKRYKV